MTDLKIANKTQLNFIVAGGNSNIINSGAQNTCLYTMNNNTTINTDIVCSKNINTKLDIKLLSTGYSPNMNSIYQGNSNTLSIGDSSSGSYNPVLKKIVITVDFYCNPTNKIVAKVGVIKHTGSNGWYPSPKKNSVGNKNATHPLLFDSFGIGIQLKYEGNKISYYGDIINTSEDSSQYSSFDSYDGFGKKIYPYINDLGLIAKFQTPCPGLVNIHCQRIAGNKELSDKISGYSNMSINAKNALIGQYKRNGDILCLTALGKTKIKDYQISGGITCSDVKSENSNAITQNGRVLKWNFCCFTECKPFKYFRNLGELDIYGINISTPGYLNKSVGLNTNNDDVYKKETPPISCQVYCAKNICGFNIPMYINLINNQIGNTIIDSNNDNVSTQNSAFYFGISPNITFSKIVHTDIAKKICHVEGGEE